MIAQIVSNEANKHVTAGIVKKYKNPVTLKPTTQNVIGTRRFFTNNGSFSVCVESIKRIEAKTNNVRMRLRLMPV
jgi:hypothetical protein